MACSSPLSSRPSQCPNEPRGVPSRHQRHHPHLQPDHPLEWLRDAPEQLERALNTFDGSWYVRTDGTEDAYGGQALRNLPGTGKSVWSAPGGAEDRELIDTEVIGELRDVRRPPLQRTPLEVGLSVTGPVRGHDSRARHEGRMGHCPPGEPRSRVAMKQEDGLACRIPILRPAYLLTVRKREMLLRRAHCEVPGWCATTTPPPTCHQRAERAVGSRLMFV